MNTSRSSPDGALPRAPVVGVQESLITIDISQTPVRKNEVVYVLLGEERLKAEVLRIQGDTADAQVVEETAGVKVGDQVELLRRIAERLYPNEPMTTTQRIVDTSCRSRAAERAAFQVRSAPARRCSRA